MFGNHVGKKLSAYAHGELAPRETALVSEHLSACRKCREAYEEIKLGIRLAETLPSRTAPASLWERLESELAKQQASDEGATSATKRLPTDAAERPPLFPATQTRFFKPRRSSLFGWRRAAASAFALLFAMSAGFVWLYVRSAREAWEVARLAGAPKVGSNAIHETGRLAVGEWLETDANSRASIRVANIGQVEVDPETRIRLVETGATEHRMELARGRMHAVVSAPPRVFFVNTPSAVAADLGCAYTLEVDDRGRSLLRVTAGWVALETRERDSVVPAGAACLTVPGTGPGTPFFEDAPDALLDALSSFDFEGGGSEALNSVLASARPRDTLTLWHLLARAEGDERARVYERLAALSPPPSGVTREGVLRLDPSMLDRWKESLENTWLEETMPALRKAWRNLWK